MLLTDRIGFPEGLETSQIEVQSAVGDETAFRGFYDRTVAGLRLYLRITCKNVTVADDLLQESYLRFLRFRVHELNEFQMKAYLYKTATSVVRDYWRSENRHRRWKKHVPTECRSTDNHVLSSGINELFRRLNPNQQTLLWLAYVEGFQHREIAKMLNLKEKSVGVLLFRTRRQFAEMLSQEGLSPTERS